MPSVADNYPPASFGGVVFPTSKWSVRGGLRRHVHEYPHTPGGALEKLGRRLYEVRYTVPAHATLEGYPDFFPGDIDTLRAMFEREETQELVIPHLGTIRACAVEWEEMGDGRVRSGVTVELTFQEDQEDAGLVSTVDGSRSVFEAASKAFEEDLPDEFSNLFDDIAGFLGQIQALLDAIELANDLIEAKLSGLIAQLQRLDESLELLDQPVNDRVAQAMRDLAVAAMLLQESLYESASPRIAFVAPTDMSVAQISQRLYGSSERAVEIMKLNPIEDPFNVLRGTVLSVFAPLAA